MLFDQKIDFAAAAASIGKSRAKLLETSNRNPLLNFKINSKTKVVRLQGVSIEGIQDLVNRQKSIGFDFIIPFSLYEIHERNFTEEEAEELNGDPLKCSKARGVVIDFSLPLRKENTTAIVPRESSRAHGYKFPTPYFKAELTNRLKKIFDHTRLKFEETGIRSSYLVVGFLKWRDLNSNKDFLAPLLSIPVVVGRKNARDIGSSKEYDLSVSSTDVEENITLKLKLNDFGFILPEYSDGENYYDYLLKIEEVVGKYNRNTNSKWEVLRYAALCCIEFSTQLMHRDLDPENWPEGLEGMLNGTALGTLYPKSQYAAGVRLENEHDIDGNTKIHTTVPLIYNADSSQHDALIDVLEGRKDLIIQGPPGTGKSQTITNLIAAGIYQGKKILFVSEKMAALQVVKKRLDDAGLGVFCFDLHSSLSNKKEILEDIKKRIDLNPFEGEERSYEEIIKRYESLKNQLNKYERVINSKWKETDRTIHEWMSLKARKSIELSAGNSIVPTPCLVLKVDTDTINDSLLLECHEEMQKFSAAYDKATHLMDGAEIIDFETHPWFGVANKNLRESTRVRIVEDQLTGLQEALVKLGESLAKVDELLGENGNDSIEYVRKLSKEFQAIPEMDEKIVWGELKNFCDDDYAHALDNYVKNISDVRKFYLDIKDILTKESAENIIQSRAFPNVDFFDCAPSLSIGDLARLSKEIEYSLKCLEDKIENLKRFSDSMGMPKFFIDQAFDERRVDKGILFFENYIDDLEKLPESLRGVQWETTKSSKSDIEYFAKLSAKLIDLSGRVRKVYDLKSLPKYPELKRYIQEYKNAGVYEKILQFFGGKFAQIKKEILSWSKIGEDCFSADSLDCLLEYSRLESDYLEARFDDKFGDLFNGLKTNPDDLRAYYDWQLFMQDKYGYCRGLCDFSFKLNAGEFRYLITQSGVDGVSEAINELKELLKKFPGATIPSRYEGEFSIKNGIGVFLNTLQKEIDAVKECVISDVVRVSTLREIKDRSKKTAENVEKLKILEQKDLGFVDVLPREVWDDLFDEKISKVKSTQKFFKSFKEVFYNYGIFKKNLEELTKELYLNLSESIAAFLSDFVDFTSKYNEFSNDVELKKEQWQNGTSFSLGELQVKQQRALRYIEDLPNWVTYVRNVEKLENSMVFPVIQMVLDKKVSLTNMENYLDYSASFAVCQDIQKEYPDLPSSLDQNQLQKKFRECDRNLLSEVRRMISSRLAEYHGEPGWGNRASDRTEMTLINHEISKQKRHLPLRQLISRAQNSLLGLKPCWMMSPFSVAQVLEPGKIEFDLIVMDEASQILPEYAIGALARARQAVIVGDPCQLPPTTFFKASYDDEDEEDVDYDDGQESILEAFSTSIPSRQLMWHYRSQHESLIQFSNREFYSDKLIVFPSPLHESERLGIKFHYVENGFYSTGVNNAEAMMIAKAIIDHAHNNPQESLGVVAMNSAQRDRIEACLDTLTKGFDSAVERMINRKSEGLFIKNLENVQGDERDVIFISFTYGKDKDSKKVHQRFGPINTEKGWRRLNVLFTRAKKRMHVFSSMLDSDILPNSGASSYKSVKALKDFLTYAKSGVLPSRTSESGRLPDSDFEIAVAEYLKEKGFECRPQVGAEGFFIDIAVVNPADPGTYLMGIECDGATYHSSRTARDRDRLRQEILESKGWRIERIWSTDWFENPEATIAPIVDKLKQLVQSAEKKSIVDVEKASYDGAPLEEFVLEQDNEESSDNGVTGESDEEIDKENEALRSDLLSIREEIEQNLGNACGENGLLRDQLLEMFVKYRPTNSEEFARFFPEQLRTKIDHKQAEKYLLRVFETINEFV